MTEPDSHHTRDIPKRRGVKVADLVWLVRVPGRPKAIRVYTADEEAEADQYAALVAGAKEPLPVADPVWAWDAHPPTERL